MIELRWHERPRELSVFVIEGSVSRTYRVLQYRQCAFAESIIPGLGGYGSWSEWQDVPIVEWQAIGTQIAVSDAADRSDG